MNGGTVPLLFPRNGVSVMLARCFISCLKEILMHTIRTHFGGLDTGDTFIHTGIIYKKTAPGKALNCHTLRTQTFKPDTLVEVTPN
jgi:hypothetical protein